MMTKQLVEILTKEKVEINDETCFFYDVIHCLSYLL